MRETCESVIVTAAAGETTVRSDQGRLYGVVIETDGSNAVAVLLEKGTTEIMTLHAAATPQTKEVLFPAPIKFNGDLDVTVTGTNGQAAILHGP